MTVNDKYTNKALEEENTVEFKVVARKPKPETPIVPRTPKKMHLERMTLSGTTSTMLQAIKRVNAEHLAEYFEQTCDWRLQKTAVIYGSSEITYQELDQRANQLAHFLISQEVGKGEPIGILLEHSLNSYIAMLSILKAGAAFVPLDSSFSANQVTFIAQDAGLRGIVTTSDFREKTSALRCPVLELDLASRVISGQDMTRPQLRIDPASLCYIIYTLDSTGHPKGIAFSHANIVNFLRAFNHIYGVRSNDRVYQGMPMAFDFALQEIWPTWIAGATLVTGPANAPLDGHAFTEFLIEHDINVLCCVPAQLAIIERDVPTLRTILIGGAICPTELIQRWSHPGRRMLGTYGPTETTITTTWCELLPNRPSNIGTPLPTSQVYILDNQLRPVRDGESGEICIGGLGVAPGYINRPDFMNECFISNPVRHEREIVPRLYRTGDIGRITSTGGIEYLGPIDTQARSRGYRRELEEIERIILPSSNTAFHAAIEAIAEAETTRIQVARPRSITDTIKQIITDPLYINSIYNMASTFILGGLGFFFWIIIARLYKPEMVGTATTLISIMSLLGSFTILGLHVSLNRYLPKLANKNDLINSSFIVVALFTILVSIIFFLGLKTFSPDLLFLRANLLYSISFVILVIFNVWNSLIESVLRAFRSAGNILIKNTIVSILKLVLPFVFIVFGAYGIFASNAAAFALGVIYAFIVLIIKFKVKPAISINISLLKETSVYSFANYIAGFMFGLPNLALPVIVFNDLSAKYAAYYYIASMIQNILLIIPTAAAQSLLTEGSYNETELKKHVLKAAKTILVILVPSTAVIVFGGKLMLQFFGKSYADEAFQFLQLYSLSTIFTSIMLITNAIMNVKHQVKSLVVSNVLSAILTLAAVYALISYKLVGVGWAWILGQGIAGLISIFIVIGKHSSASEIKHSANVGKV